MKGRGYIKLYRDLLSHPVFADPYLLKLLNYCLLKASHQERDYILDNNVINLLPGEFIWGRKVATEELNYKAKPNHRMSEKTWERKLLTLEKIGFLTRKVTNKYTIINIVNWGYYQKDDNKSDQLSNQQMTNKRPADDQQMTTDNNVKNLKKEKNDKDISSSDDEGNSELSPEFNEWWILYDLKRSRKQAIKAFDDARKEFSFEEIMEGTKNYLKTVIEKDFQLYPDKFLRDERFTDEYDPNDFDGFLNTHAKKPRENFKSAIDQVLEELKQNKQEDIPIEDLPY